MNKEKENKIVWNVFYYDMNKKEIVKMNIFDHYSFQVEVKDLIKKFKDKNDFAHELKSSLMYYFWSKCEYEVLITPWVGAGKEDRSIKIDIYTQVEANWDIFVDYVWLHKEEMNEL